MSKSQLAKEKQKLKDAKRKKTKMFPQKRYVQFFTIYFLYYLLYFSML